MKTRITTTLITLLLVATASSADFSVGPIPASAPTGFSAHFDKHVDVLGLHVYATDSTEDEKVLHAANVLAEWIDNDEDGVADSAAVQSSLADRHGSILIFATEADYQQSGFEASLPTSVASTVARQTLIADQVAPAGEAFDTALDASLELITRAGYADVHPMVFGAGGQVASAMAASVAAGFIQFDDPACDEPCQIAQYATWGLTSMLGAQDKPWRIAEVTEKWQLYNAELLTESDASLVGILEDPDLGLPTALPDGKYSAAAVADVDIVYTGSGYVRITRGGIVRLVNRLVENENIPTKGQVRALTAILKSADREGWLEPYSLGSGEFYVGIALPYEGASLEEGDVTFLSDSISFTTVLPFSVD